MGKPILDISDSAFNQKMSIEYELLVHITPDHFNYLIHDSRMHVMTLKSYPIEHYSGQNTGAGIRDIYVSDNNLSLSFRKIRVAVNSKVYTLIPEAFYFHENEIDCLREVSDIPDELVVFSNLLPESGIRNIAAMDKSIQAALKNYFKALHLFHSLSPLISGYRYIAQNKSGKQLFVNLQQNLAQLLLFDSKELVFSNQFEFNTTQDCLYYLMLIFDQFQLDQEEIPVFISGMLLENSEIYQAMYKYIRHIGFVQVPAHLHFSEQFREVHHHFYFDLYSLTLCE